MCFIIPGCDVTMEGDSGVILSPGYDIVPYPNMVKCMWTIKSSAPIRLLFKDSFDLASEDSLEVSYWFEIYYFNLQNSICAQSHDGSEQLVFCVVMTTVNQLYGSASWQKT